MLSIVLNGWQLFLELIKQREPQRRIVNQGRVFMAEHRRDPATVRAQSRRVEAASLPGELLPYLLTCSGNPHGTDGLDLQTPGSTSCSGKQHTEMA